MISQKHRYFFDTWPDRHATLVSIPLLSTCQRVDEKAQWDRYFAPPGHYPDIFPLLRALDL